MSEFDTPEVPFLKTENALQNPELSAAVLAEQIAEEEKRLDSLDGVRFGLNIDKSKVPEGLLSRLFSKTEDEQTQRLVEVIRQKAVARLREETDIYKNADKLGGEFDPYVAQIEDMRLGHEVSVKVEKRDAGVSTRLGMDASYMGGMYDPNTNDVTILIEEDGPGFKEILLGMTIREQVSGEHVTLAHEASHAGIAGSKRPRSEKMEIVGQFAETRKRVAEIIAFYGDKEFRDKYGTRSELTYSVFTEVVARVAQADFGFEEIMSLEAIFQELYSVTYEEVIRYYNTQKDVMDMDEFVERVYLLSSALTTFGYSGVDIERHMCEQFDPASKEVLGPDWFVKKMEDWFEENRARHPNLIMSSTFDLQKVAFQRSRLRHLRTERILLECASEVLRDNPMDNEASRVLDFSDGETVAIRLLDQFKDGDANSVDIVVRPTEAVTFDPLLCIEMREVDKNLMFKVGELVFFSSYTKDELSSLAEWVWGHMDDEKRGRFMETVRGITNESEVAFSGFDKTNGRLLEAVLEIATKEVGSESDDLPITSAIATWRRKQRGEYLLTLGNGRANFLVSEMPKELALEKRDGFNKRVKSSMSDNQEMSEVLEEVFGDSLDSPFDLYKKMSENRYNVIKLAGEFVDDGEIDLPKAIIVLNSLLPDGRWLENSPYGVEKAAAVLELLRICNKEYFA